MTDSERIARLEALVTAIELSLKRVHGNCEILNANQVNLATGLNRLAARLTSIEDEIDFVECPVNKQEAH